MAYKPPISKERKQAITRAYLKWYESQSDKVDAMNRIGAKPEIAYFFRRGKLIPQPDALLILYEETEDATFLFTREEKEHTLRRNQHVDHIPPEEEWPNREDVIARPHLEQEMHDLRRDIKKITERINRFGKMAEDDPKREQARMRLVGPALELFQALQRLNLKFPSAFEDLLQQMSLASKLTNPHK